VENIANSRQLLCPLSAPAGAGKTTSLRALATVARRRHTHVYVVAPTGKAVDVAVREGAGDQGYTVAAALKSLEDGTLTLGHLDLVVVDEAGMVSTDAWRRLLTATTAAHTKTVLVGDTHQLAPVKPRRHVRPTLRGPAVDATALGSVADARPAGAAASLTLRDGGAAPVRRAVAWYRDPATRSPSTVPKASPLIPPTPCSAPRPAATWPTSR
jgi:hypothetical protein